MLTPPVLVQPRALVVGSVALAAMIVAGVLVERKVADPPRQPPLRCLFEDSGPSLAARVSPRSDTVIEIELQARLAVRHIFVNGSGGADQWDTVEGNEPIPFGRVYGGYPGDATPQLVVREHAGAPTARTHLELIAIGDTSPGPRTVTVMFTDGTTMTAAVTD